MKTPIRRYIFQTLKFAFVALVAVSAAPLSAAIKMPSIFSDNMLLQRGKKVKIWGTSDPRATVEVEFANQKKSAMADADGKWVVWLSPMKASANPRDLKVYENGEEAAKIKNVVVGELWILGGQSNMQWTLDKTDDAHVAIPRANYPNLRYFRMNLGAMSETPQSDFPGGKWELTSPENVGTQSAVGFYFGEKLLKDLGVPVGLINTSMGGTLMACWTPAEYIDRIPYLKDYYSNYLKASKKYVESGGYAKKQEAYKKNLAEYEAACKKAEAEKKPKPPYDWNKLSVPLDYTPYRNHEVPIRHWNAKVAPMAGIAARGVVWYQGEQESGYGAGNPKAVEAFGDLYENMVGAWREKWGDKKLWFLCAELPSFGGALGGFTTGRKEIIDLLRQRSRPYLFSNSLAPGIIGASLEVFKMLKESNALHDKLLENVNYFRDKMTAAGFDIKPTQSAICAVMLYDAKLSQIYATRMQEEGIYVTGFYYPVVPKDQARIRVQISAGHEKEHLDKCIAAFIKVGKELGVLK